MKKISIHRKGVLTNQASFESEEKANEWLNSCLAKEKFGLPERLKAKEECSSEELASSLETEIRELRPETTVEHPAELDEEGNETKPASVEVIPAVTKVFHKLPAEFIVTIEDVVPHYTELRAKEFAKLDKMKEEATIEYLAEGRTEKLEQYKQLRAEIKLLYPKPE